MFFLLAIVLILVLPSPWNIIGAAVSVGLFVLEAGYWQRRVRGQKVETGVQTMIGATGEVTEQLAPTGMVRVLGELWQAHSSDDLAPGARVRVVAVDGLMLEVEAADARTARRS
jgi:membrane-bound serine protease (ClpP class)